ncbi:hypothetical protein NMY22_g2499 [Coprinellus aureogranulatus]|nr:hypothetical protein NMY22_g2499 [Coprinellus aureogranulatus]
MADTSQFDALNAELTDARKEWGKVRFLKKSLPGSQEKKAAVKEKIARLEAMLAALTTTSGSAPLPGDIDLGSPLSSAPPSPTASVPTSEAPIATAPPPYTPGPVPPTFLPPGVAAGPVLQTPITTHTSHDGTTNTNIAQSTDVEMGEPTLEQQGLLDPALLDPNLRHPSKPLLAISPAPDVPALTQDPSSFISKEALEKVDRLLDGIDGSLLAALVHASRNFTEEHLGQAVFAEVTHILSKIYTFKARDVQSEDVPIANGQDANDLDDNARQFHSFYTAPLYRALAFQEDLLSVSGCLEKLMNEVDRDPRTRTPAESKALLLAVHHARIDLNNIREHFLTGRKLFFDLWDIHKRDQQHGQQADGLKARREEIKERLDELRKLMRRGGHAADMVLAMHNEYSSLCTEEDHVKKQLKSLSKKMMGGRAKAKETKETAGDVKTRMPFDELPAEEQEKLIERGRRECQKYLETRDETAISFSTRRLIREEQSYLPEAVHASRDLALLILKTSTTNTICRYHQQARGQTPSDGFDGKTQGVAYPKILGTKDQPVKPAANHLNCGCHVKHALLDLIWWKTMKIGSTHPERMNYPEEGLRDDVISPRLRSFIVKIFDTFSNLSVGELYLGGEAWGSVDHEVALLTSQLFRIVDRLDILGQQVDIDESGRVVVTSFDD